MRSRGHASDAFSWLSAKAQGASELACGDNELGAGYGCDTRFAGVAIVSSERRGVLDMVSVSVCQRGHRRLLIWARNRRARLHRWPLEISGDGFGTTFAEPWI